VANRTQGAAWVLSLISILIEVVGAIITVLLAQRNTAEYTQIASPKEEGEQFDKQYDDVESVLTDVMPKMDSK
jgi:hypothetical protein